MICMSIETLLTANKNR